MKVDITSLGCLTCGPFQSLRQIYQQYMDSALWCLDISNINVCISGINGEVWKWWLDLLIKVFNEFSKFPNLNSAVHTQFTDPDGLINPSTQMTNTGPFLWNGSSKIQFFTDIWYSSWRGCWGQPMSFFWKLVDKTQMCNPPEATRHHDSRKLLILLPLRAI